MGFFFKNGNTTESTVSPTLIRPYKLSLDEKRFINTRTQVLYEKILKRCYHKTIGLDDDKGSIASSIFLSVEYGAEQNGTIPLVAKAMTDMRKIYLVYSEKAGLVRIANLEEQQEIDKHYKEYQNTVSLLNGGNRGMVLDFSRYEMTRLIKCYMSLLYAVLDSANTQVNLARSLQIKIDKLRENISVLTSDDAIKQANQINDALKSGDSVLLAKLDDVIQTAINSDSTAKAIEIFNTALASDLGLSLSFVSGALTSGMSATGDADINYEDAGIKDFWVTIWRPICLKLYGKDSVKYKTDRWRSLEAKLKSLVYIESSLLFTDEQKAEYAQDILNDEI